MQPAAESSARLNEITTEPANSSAKKRRQLLQVRVLIGLLVLSLLGNAAGITFFVCYLHQRGQSVRFKKQAAELDHQLQITRIAGAYLPEFLTPPRISRQVFMSQLDNHEDCFATAPTAVYAPDGNVGLIVYLHGMGGDYLEPFVFPKNKPFGPVMVSHFPATIILSPNYRGLASFGNAPALADISQNIRQILQQYPIKKIVIAGTSMGGCTALNYAATAPSDIQDKIIGVVSVEASGDLAALYNETKSESVHGAIARALGGQPSQVPHQYRQFSFLTNIHRLPPRIKVALVSGTKDEVIPTHFQDDLLNAISHNNNPTKMLKFDGPHGFPDDSMLLEALDFAAHN